jgi:hypothetical protein
MSSGYQFTTMPEFTMMMRIMLDQRDEMRKKNADLELKFFDKNENNEYQFTELRVKNVNVKTFTLVKLTFGKLNKDYDGILIRLKALGPTLTRIENLVLQVDERPTQKEAKIILELVNAFIASLPRKVQFDGGVIAQIEEFARDPEKKK